VLRPAIVALITFREAWDLIPPFMGISSIDPVEDLRTVCPNCHTMIHRRNPSYSIEELKRVVPGLCTARTGMAIFGHAFQDLTMPALTLFAFATESHSKVWSLPRRRFEDTDDTP
jgi:hypothetical protein